MKLEDLMKQIEATNALNDCVGYCKIYAVIEVDGITLNDVWHGSYRFYDWKHVESAFAEEYIEKVLADINNERLHHEHRNVWKIHGKVTTIVITLYHE